MSSFEPAVDANAVIVCVVALAIWVTMAWLHTALRKRRLRIALVLPRMAAAFTFWLMVLRTADGLIETSPHWSFRTIGFVAAVVSEVVFWCYPSLQIPDGPTRRFQTYLSHLPFLLRFGVIGLLAILLLQPTRSHEEEKRQERTIAVIMDTSASMNLAARTAPDDDRKRREIANELLADRDQGGKGILTTP